MGAPFSTLLLDTATWDLTLDASGNIARADPPYAVAQDMSSQCRQWRGEFIFNVNDGVPLSTILGSAPNLGLMKSDFAVAAGQVPGTSNVKCFITSIVNRQVTGQVQATVTLSDGSTLVVAANISPPIVFITIPPTVLTDDSGDFILTGDDGTPLIKG
jgi:hypothetical protein